MSITSSLYGLLMLASMLSGCDDEASLPPPAEMSGEDRAELDLSAPADPLDAEGLDRDVSDVSDLDGLSDLGVELDASEPAELIADAGASQRVYVGALVTLDGSASLGAIAYQWSFGDGSEQPDPVEDPRVEVSYDSPGRYRATLTVIGADGETRRDQVVITVLSQPLYEPLHSDTLTHLIPGALGGAEGSERLAVVVTDDDALVIFEGSGSTFERVARLDTADDPRTLVAWSVYPERPMTSARIAVVCQRAGVVQLFSQLTGALAATVTLPPASRPYGATPSADGKRLFVTLQGTGQIAELIIDSSEAWSVGRLVDVGPDLRGIALLPTGALMITRWRSPDPQGEVWVWDPEGDTAPQLISLAYDPQRASDTEIGGVPNYLDQVLIPAVGGEVALPSTQAHFAHGLFTSGAATSSDEVLRAVVSFIELGSSVEEYIERFERRKQFDGRGLASAGVYTRGGDYLYLAMRGSRTIERLDRFSGNQSGTLVDTGYAVEGLALSRDERLLFVNATLDRLVKVYDVSDLSTLPRPIAEIPLVDVEPLSLPVLLGKQLFNDSADPRLSREGYIACAHCHLEGDSDHRTWDFSDRGEGLRQTISLLGRGGMGHGPLHWSGNFDELQDFESDLRGPFGGLGLMSDLDYHEGTRAQTFGDPKAGQSLELDALAAYMTSLNTHLPSPYRQADGSLSEAAQRGEELFNSAEVGCAQCHRSPRFTDSEISESGEPRLHDVGTLTALSGERLGAPLTGLDTPTLNGLWHSAPYLHDGSAATLLEVLVDANPDDRHGTTSGLSESALSDLELYLLSLDGR